MWIIYLGVEYCIAYSMQTAGNLQQIITIFHWPFCISQAISLWLDMSLHSCILSCPRIKK
jgi:hypothetical protein